MAVSPQNAKITVYVQGYALTRHATARLTLTLNGETVVKNFPARTDGSYTESLEVPVIARSVNQLYLAIDEQPSSGKGTAYINVSTIDAAIS